MTPTEQDNELRDKVAELLAKDLFYDEKLDEFMQLITADRRRVALEARIDENNRWRTILANESDRDTAYMEDFNDRVVELTKELEKWR